jgi:hypothetical protein
MSRTKKSVNPFYKWFEEYFPSIKKDKIKQLSDNSVGVNEGNVAGSAQSVIGEFFGNERKGGQYGASSFNFIDFQPIFNSKKAKIDRYRGMYLFPEINHATDIVVNDSILPNSNGEITSLRFKQVNDDADAIPKAIQKKMIKIYDMMINEVFNFNDTAEDLFLKFLIEGEIFVELIMNDTKDNLVGIRILPTYSMIPVYDTVTSNIIKFVQYEDIIEEMFTKNTGMIGTNTSNQRKFIEFAPNQIAYANYGQYGKNSYDVQGYYSSAIRTYYHIKAIDDSLAIYRAVRAPETRVWNVYTGQMTKGKAENYLKNLVSRIRKKNFYNFDTGEIDQNTNVKSIVQDYWFTKDDSGNQTDISEVGGNMDIGNIEDLKYYQDKLYKSLKIPSGRWDKDMAGEWESDHSRVAQEEVMFAHFIERLHKNFKNVLLAPFEILCKMNDIDEKYLTPLYYDIEFNQKSHWKFYFDQQTWSQRFNALSDARDAVYNKEENPEGFMSREWFAKNVMMISDKDWEDNVDMVAKEKELDAANSDEEDDGDSFGRF